jgi:Ca2+/H+ antiporter
MPPASNEPVLLAGLVTTALITTLNVPALIFAWPADVVAALNIAIGAWAAVASWIVRAKVSPTNRAGR